MKNNKTSRQLKLLEVCSGFYIFSLICVVGECCTGMISQYSDHFWRCTVTLCQAPSFWSRSYESFIMTRGFPSPALGATAKPS